MSAGTCQQVAPEPLTVLLVDDSAAIRSRVMRMLDGNDGIAVVGEAGSTESALELVEKQNPDLVILDIAIPSIGGIGLLGKLRERGATPRVCMLTSFPNPEYRRHCEVLGADYFLDKATEFEKLVEVVDDCRETKHN